MSSHRLSTVLTALALLAAGPVAAPALQADAPPPAATPAALPGASLLELVPAGAASAWSVRPDPGTRLATSYAFEVVDAALEARFDEWLLSALEAAGLDEDLRLQVASVRNMAAAVGAIVPWRALVEREFVYAESFDPPLCADLGLPSALLACRPVPARRDALVRSLTSFLGALAAFGQPFVRYDIVREPGPDGQQTTRYRLCAPLWDDVELVQLAVRDDVLLLGLGGGTFAAAHELLVTGQGPRLVDTPRFRAAFGDLPTLAPSLAYIDVDALVAGLSDVRGRLLQREFGGGVLQGMVGEAFDLAGAVDTIATVTRGEGTLLVSETWTRFDPGVATRAPLLAASLAAPASPALLELVPADAVSFSMRGRVDLLPFYQQALGKLLASWESAEAALWALDTAQATLDLSIERDLLSWLGSEHVVIELPDRRRPGATESVLVLELADPRGARKVLERLEAIYHAAVPRVLASLQEKLRAVGSPIVPEVTLGPSSGPFPGLRELTIKLGGPFQVPPITYGLLGDALVVGAGRDGIGRCLAVAAGEEDGLAAHPLAAGLLGRDDLTSAHLQPVGRQMLETARGVDGFGRTVRGLLGPAAKDAPGLATFLDVFGSFMDRLVGVLEVVDFLGDAVVHGEVREGGLVRYERRVQQLLTPEQRPSQGRRAPRPAPAPEAPERTPTDVTRR